MWINRIIYINMKAHFNYSIAGDIYDKKNFKTHLTETNIGNLLILQLAVSKKRIFPGIVFLEVQVMPWNVFSLHHITQFFYATSFSHLKINAAARSPSTFKGETHNYEILPLQSLLKSQCVPSSWSVSHIQAWSWSSILGIVKTDNSFPGQSSAYVLKNENMKSYLQKNRIS